jgi:HAUS augmin-like complex subunit 8
MMQSTSDLLALSDIEDTEQQRHGKQSDGDDRVPVQAIDLSTKVTRHIIGTSSQSQQQAIILVDATNPKEPVQSEELPVTTSIYSSPIRVIRHSPKRIEANNWTVTQQGAVKDGVLVTLSDFEETESELDKHEYRQRVSRSARSLAMSQRDSFGGENDDLGVMALEPAVNEELYRKMESSVRQEIAEKNQRETSAGGREESKPIETKKKKKKGRIVPSRYMSKVQTKDQSLLEHKTAVAARVKLKPQRSSRVDTIGQSKATEPQSHSHNHSQSRHKKSTATPLPIQPVDRSVWQSTPFAGNDSHVALRSQAAAGPDVSYITGDMSRDVTMKDGHHSTVGFASFHEQTRHSTSHAGAAHKSKEERSGRGKLISNAQVTDKDLYLLGCRMRQWSFLATMADKALHEQEKDAMNQLYAIWSETEKLRQRHHSLTAALKEANCNEELDQMLDVQLKGLAPILKIMERLEPQYSRLALALDTTRHHLPTQGIKLPDKPGR